MGSLASGIFDRPKMFWQVLVINLLLAVGTPTSASDFSPDDQQNDGPIITPASSEITLQMGQNFTIYCRGKRKVQIKQQEIPEENYGLFKMQESTFTSDDPENIYGAALTLYNVDRLAVGYYACFDDTIVNIDFLLDIKEEPQNTEHISFIYIYVDGTKFLFAPLTEYVITKKGSSVVIGCKPTTPDVKVTLNMSSKKYSPKIGFFIKTHPKGSFVECQARRGNETSNKTIHLSSTSELPQLEVAHGSKYFLEGETFTLNCTTEYKANFPIMLTWTYPPNTDESFIQSLSNHDDYDTKDKIVYKNITIMNATKQNAGNYTCTITSTNKENKNSYTFQKIMVTPFLKLAGTRPHPKNKQEDNYTRENKMHRFRFTLTSYPEAKITYLKDNIDITHDDQYKQDVKPISGTYSLTIPRVKVNHTGNYTLFASNGYINDSFTYNFKVDAVPVIDDRGTKPKYFVKNTVANVRCDLTGYPLPKVSWNFVTEDGKEDKNIMGTDTVRSSYEMTSIFNFKKIQSSGNLTCNATNNLGSALESIPILVYEIYGGFGIRNEENWFSEGEKVELTCLGSKYDYERVMWMQSSSYVSRDIVEYTENEFSIIAKLKLHSIRLDQAGNYTCIGVQFDGENRSESITITVTEQREIEFFEPDTETTLIESYEFLPVTLTCMTDAVPRAKLLWFKDGNILTNSSEEMDISFAELNYTSVKSTLSIPHMVEKHQGKYECVASNWMQNSSRFFDLCVIEKRPLKVQYIIIAGITFILLLLLVLYLVLRVMKEKKKRKELAAAGLLHFKDGVPGSINPELGIDEQAELLPYDSNFEFPAECLSLGKQLGSGAFGVVYKAEARGILNAEETTVVAVKTVRRNADNMYIKALSSELKIMVHLGKHINIVNLLGACTKNVAKRELIVIVEYCKYGCIYKYLQKHREVFVDQLTDNKEKGFGRTNRGFSSSSANSGLDYTGYSNQSQGTDNTFLNSGNTNRSARKDTPSPQPESVKASDTSYVQPEWRTNYEGDYSYNGGSPTPLCSRDLLCWAFQIARGMEYLASRKILHGDLAARNILLAEDNIVKICDFGLARSIIKNDEYKKKENCLVPIKWLAIECMVDRIFSTQSDVWAYGVVLWELFSLAKAPYPNINLQHLLEWLLAGNRLAKPAYADDQLYSVMLRCWDKKPTNRPSFTELQEILGSFLEINVRNHYIDLNSPYNDINTAKRGDGVEDYLAMVSPPDYNQMVAPSPNPEVVNNFSRPLQHDDEGYLQMSPATKEIVLSQRPQDNKFDFNLRKLGVRIDTPTNSQSEMTPMLTLNTPTRGSESDHDGSISPYLKMRPIEEEENEVFEMQNNIRNVTKDAFSNPTYIGIEVNSELEKKPQNIVHYVNGLVK